jgi:hypothetical protein
MSGAVRKLAERYFVGERFGKVFHVEHDKCVRTFRGGENQALAHKRRKYWFRAKFLVTGSQKIRKFSLLSH